VFEHYNDSWKGTARSTAPGLELYDEIIAEIQYQLVDNGPVWQAVFKPHIQNVKGVLRRLQFQPGEMMLEVLRKPLLQRFVPRGRCEDFY